MNTITDFKKLMNNLNIRDISEKDRFKMWFWKIGGYANFTEEDIEKGYENHFKGINRIIIKYDSRDKL